MKNPAKLVQIIKRNNMLKYNQKNKAECLLRYQDSRSIYKQASCILLYNVASSSTNDEESQLFQNVKKNKPRKINQS